MSLQDCAYAAGFFDGEGWVTISKTTAPTCRSGKQYSLQVGAVQVNPEPLYWLQEIWGGSVRLRRKASTKGKPIYHWSLYAQNAAEFLLDIIGYLKVKGPQAELAIEFQSMKKRSGRNGHPPEVYDNFESIRNSVMELNSSYRSGLEGVRS